MQFRQALASGVVLADQYRIDQVLGSGGFGITYLAEDLGLKSVVVVKEYFPGQLAVREGAEAVHPRSPRDTEIYAFGRDRFLQEARILDRCQHPHIVRVRRVIEANNTAYMALDFVPGVSLETWLAQLGRRPTQAEIDRICTPVLDALAYIHTLPQPIVHRDISPDNIMMRDGTTPVLIDFGAARVEVAGRTASRAGAYKFGYSPPEQQAQRSDWQGPWTDIYAFAATLRRAITGAAPPDCLERQIDDAMPKAAAMRMDGYRPSFLAALDAGMALRHQERPRTIDAWRPMLMASTLPTRTSAFVDRARAPRPGLQIRHAVSKVYSAWPIALLLPMAIGAMWGVLRQTPAAVEVAIAAPFVRAPATTAPDRPAEIVPPPAELSPTPPPPTMAGLRITRPPEAIDPTPLQVIPAAAITKPVNLVTALSAAQVQALRPLATFKECTHCPELVVLPAGQFAMGSTEDGAERPAHKVALRRPLAVGKFEVTFDEWEACVAGGGCTSNPHPGDKGWGRGRRPVIHIAWTDAKEYVAWLTETTGKTYRLPSEAEWEYAARAGTSTRYSWGNNLGVGQANCDGCGSRWDGKQTAPVGSFGANAFGLHDTAGNAWEWCEDGWHADYRGAPSDGSVWAGGFATLRITRGGSWQFDPSFARSPMRLATPPNIRSDTQGFRVARTL